MISKRAHFAMDSIYGCVLLSCPYLFDMAQIPNVKGVFFWTGLLTFANILLSRVVSSSTRLHMKIDLIIGVVLILAPTIFSYRALLSSTQYSVHILAGFLFILLVGETRYRHEVSIAGSKIILDV